MTTRIYQTDPNKFQLSAIVTSINELGGKCYVTTDQTIFHAKGGGQPADSGTINGISIDDVKIDRETGQVIHTISTHHQWVIGQEVEMLVDKEKRTQLSKWHSAGHLLAGILENKRPDLKAVGAHQYPGEGRVEFEIPPEFDVANFDLGLINSEIKNTINETRNIGIHHHPDGMRYIWIEGFKPVGCGGTHVSSTGEIGLFIVSKASISSGKLRVSYRLVD